MAEEKAPEQKTSSEIIKLIILGVASILVPAICAILVFFFVLKPMLSTQDNDTNQSQVAESTNTIPSSAVLVKFDEAQATVITSKSDSPSPLLIYQVAMSCSDAKVAAVVEEKKDYFTAMINKIHRNRTRTELNDPGVQEALLRQAKAEANQLLKKISPKIKGEILEVMYIKYTIVDL